MCKNTGKVIKNIGVIWSKMGHLVKNGSSGLTKYVLRVKANTNTYKYKNVYLVSF